MDGVSQAAGMRTLHKLRHCINSKVLGAGLILIGCGFLLAGLRDTLIPLASEEVGIALALPGAVLVIIETHMLTHRERIHVVYGTVVYVIATGISIAGSIGAPYQSSALVAHAYAVQSNVERVAGMALVILLAMIVNSMIYVSFYLFGHRLSPLRYRPFTCWDSSPGCSCR